jgi:hypothetical protein
VGGAIPEELQAGHVAGDRSVVPGGGVSQDPAGPQVEAVQVDLGRRAVAELEVEAGLLGRRRRPANAGRIVATDRGGQDVQGAGQLLASSSGTPLPAACFQAAVMAPTLAVAGGQRPAAAP